MIRILLVDDRNLVRLGIQALLEKDSELRIIGSVRDGRSAIDATNRLKPDVVLIDIEMPGMNGITATKYISHLAPKTKVIILSSHEERKYVMQALLAGAKGYLLKDSLLTDLKQAIVAVESGYSQVDSKLLAKVFDPKRVKAKYLADIQKKGSPKPKKSDRQKERELLESSSHIETTSDRKSSSMVLQPKIKDPKIEVNTEVIKDNAPHIETVELSSALPPANVSEEKALSIVNKIPLAPLFKSFPALQQENILKVSPSSKRGNVLEFAEVSNSKALTSGDSQVLKERNSNFWQWIAKNPYLKHSKKIVLELKSKIFLQIQQLHEKNLLWKIGLFILGIVIFLVIHELRN